MRSFKLTPWLRGENSVDDQRGKVFQLPGEGELPPHASTATNVHFCEDGTPQLRPGLTELLTLVLGKSVFAGAGLLLLHDDTKIQLVDPSVPSATDKVTGLSGTNPAIFLEHDGQVFWTDQEVKGRITAGGTATNWGMATPASPTLGTTSGSLPAGDYLCSVRLKDGNGILGAAPKPAKVTVGASGGVTVNVTSPDANATHVQIYLSYADSADLWFAAEVAVGALPATVDEMFTATTDSSLALAAVDKDPLPAGVKGLGSWGGYLLAWKQNTDGDWFLFRSAGNNHHLFDFFLGAAEQEFAIKGAFGVDNGPLFVATARGLYRYTGQPRTESWVRKRMDSRKYAAGGKMVDSSRFSFLKVNDTQVPVFASQDGPVFCLPDGSIRIPLFGQDRYDVEGKTANLVYRESGEFFELLTLLR